MITKYFSLLLFVLICLSVPGLSAQSEASSPDVRVAYVDVQKALAESVAGKKAQKDYEKEVLQAQKDIDVKKGDFESKKEQFTKQKDSLSQDARAKREEELLQMERDLKRKFQDSQEMLRRRNAQIVSELVKKIQDVVSEVGKEDGFTLIVERSGQSVLYADADIDITPKVVQRFDASAIGK
ncbi:MAG: OmpH family outer membrane protein [Bdellovibrionales bacterium]|nr:OmpH family outer membrane protein [Bdellovibrionales bacterium]